MDRIKVGNIDIEVTFKSIKNVHLSVHPPHGKVTVSAPHHIELDKIKLYTATKLGWIKKEQKKFLSQPRASRKQYITQESHYFLGERKLLKVKEVATSKVILHHSAIELQVPKHYTEKQKEEVLYRWYRKELRIVLEELIIQYAKRMKLDVPGFGIRKMKSKWGSCSTERKYLWFNIELAKKPLECIEYIVVHEMTHLLERRHNDRFILLLDRYLPNWKVYKKILNELEL
jgi:predicted metal-dependent hydrolase